MSGFQGSALWSSAMVAKRPSDTTEVLSADSEAKAKAAGCLLV
jgi:hypothetical protein